jgi:hypothetical protein
MSSSLVATPNDFSVSSDMLYTAPRVNSVGGKSIGITNKNTQKSLFMRTPLMLTWGVNIYENAGKDNSYDFSLQFPRDDYATPESEDFLKCLQEMESKIKNDALTNSKDWFGKQHNSSEVIDALWSPMLKYPKDKETGEPDMSRKPTLKIKLGVWDGEYKFELYNTSNVKLFPDEHDSTPDVYVTKGSNIACILQCGGIWFANGKFGVTWRLYQGIVKPADVLPKGQCLITLDDDDKKKIDTTSSVSTSDEVVSGGESPVQSDGDNNHDTDGEEEPVQEEETVEPPKKKKVVRKKKGGE